MSRFFIERPIFAWVLAIVVALMGVLSITDLPVSQYPEIAPPAVTITATYPGASADGVAGVNYGLQPPAQAGLNRSPLTWSRRHVLSSPAWVCWQYQLCNSVPNWCWKTQAAPSPYRGFPGTS